MRTPRPGDAPAGTPWQDQRCECATTAEHAAGRCVPLPATAADAIDAAGEWLDRRGTFHVGELT